MKKILFCVCVITLGGAPLLAGGIKIIPKPSVGYYYPIDGYGGIDLILERKHSGINIGRYGEGFHLGFDYGENGYLAEFGRGFSDVIYGEIGVFADIQYLYIDDQDCSYLGCGLTLQITKVIFKTGFHFLFDGETDNELTYSLGIGIIF